MTEHGYYKGWYLVVYSTNRGKHCDIKRRKDGVVVYSTAGAPYTSVDSRSAEEQAVERAKAWVDRNSKTGEE